MLMVIFQFEYEIHRVVLKCVKLSNSYIVTRSVEYSIWAKSLNGKLLCKLLFH